MSVSFCTTWSGIISSDSFVALGLFITSCNSSGSAIGCKGILLIDDSSLLINGCTSSNVKSCELFIGPGAGFNYACSIVCGSIYSASQEFI